MFTFASQCTYVIKRLCEIIEIFNEKPLRLQKTIARLARVNPKMVYKAILRSLLVLRKSMEVEEKKNLPTKTK